jgi:predicted HTH transcriptional regulator
VPNSSLTKAEVLRRIALGEGQSVEFKETTGQIRAAVKTVAAFASQPDGGCVIIGINDDGTPNRMFQVGAKSQEQVAQTIKANTLSMVTALPLVPNIYRFEEPAMLVIDVRGLPGDDGPYLAYGERWKRSGATTNRVQMDYRQLARAYQQHLYDEDDHLGYRFCGSCGSQRLDRNQVVDARQDRVYYTIQCKECGWGDWSE